MIYTEGKFYTDLYRREIQRFNVSSFFYAKIRSLLARRWSTQRVQRVYWPENVIDWPEQWRSSCVMRHTSGQKLQNFRCTVSCPSVWIFILCYKTQLG